MTTETTKTATHCISCGTKLEGWGANGVTDRFVGDRCIYCALNPEKNPLPANVRRYAVDQSNDAYWNPRDGESREHAEQRVFESIAKNWRLGNLGVLPAGYES